MANRWIMLLIPFSACTVTGLQYQSVASSAPFLVGDLALDHARIGVLIGLYDLSGIVAALPAGLLGRRFGDKRVVLLALALMAAGGSVMGLGRSYVEVAAGRLVSGAGGIVLTVLLAKMTADWFDGREIVTAMAILVASWLAGLGIGLIVFGPLSAALSWRLVMAAAAAVSALALVLVAVVYRAPTQIHGRGQTITRGLGLSRWELALVPLAGLIWVLFNVGLLSLTSFGPSFLAMGGYTIAGAGALVSLVSWLLVFSLPVGGYLAELLARPNLVLVSCFLGIGSALCLVPFWPQPAGLFVALGLLFGPPAGIIMSLPVGVLRPENRGAGMGLFSTCSYGLGAGLMALVGWTRDLSGAPAPPLLFGGLAVFLAILVLSLFRTLHRRSSAGLRGWAEP